MFIVNKKIIFALILITIFSVLFIGLQLAFAAESESGNIFVQIWEVLSNPWDSLAGGLGNLLIAMTSTILYLAGSLFDLLIKFTIVEFASNLSGGLMTSITKVWEAFRDIGNIVIIGMFVFVAISTILGIDEYGAKKMISRLLIIAILINFSLFFTKVIIDASHITAKQFYSSMVNIAATSESGNGRDLISSNPSDTALRNVGISGAFMQRSGIVGGFDTQQFRKRIEANDGSPFTTIIVYSALVSLLMFTIAMLFLYGSFLLASRGILLIVLMITSSLAFASYLIPTFSSGKYGWKGWWDSLLKAAFMAPLLMIFLWATLFLLQSNNPKEGTTIGKFLENPGDSNTWEVAWLLIITIGLLFVSIKMSQSLSNGITGFKMSGKIPGLSALAASRFAGFAGRNTIGRGAAAYKGRLEKIPLQDRTAFQKATMRRMDDLGKSSFDAMNVKALRSGFKDIVGLKNIKEDVGKDGRIGAIGRKAERGIKEAAKTAPNEKQKKEISDNAINESKAANQGKSDTTSQAKAVHEQTAKTGKADESRLRDELTGLRGEVAKAISQNNTGAQARLQQEIQQKQNDLGQVVSRIEKAETKVSQANRIEGKLKKRELDAGKAAVEDATVGEAQRATHRRPSRLWGLIGDPENDPAVQQVVSVMKKQKGSKALKGALKDLTSTGTPPPPGGGGGGGGGGTP